MFVLLRQYLCAFLYLIINVSLAHASAEGGVLSRILEMRIKAGDSGYVFVFNANDKGDLIKITSHWNNQSKVYKVDALGEIDGVYLRGVKIYTPTEFSLGVQNKVIIFVPYAPKIVSISNDNIETVNVIRYIFSDGQLVRWEKAIRSNTKPKRWDLQTWEKGDIVRDVGFDESERNPYEVFAFGYETP